LALRVEKGRTIASLGNIISCSKRWTKTSRLFEEEEEEEDCGVGGMLGNTFINKYIYMYINVW